jgi:hypothetical protein
MAFARLVPYDSCYGWFALEAAVVKKASEFGGHAGRVQPLPHELTNVEAARLERATDPTEPLESADTQRVTEAGKRGIGPVLPNGDLT